MSFVIIHGEDQVKSRQELQKYIGENSDVVTLDGKNISLDSLTQNLESGSLFGESSRLTIVENLHRLKSKTDLKEIILYLSSQMTADISLILWENQELTKAQLGKFPKAEIVLCKISPTIFALTDAITPAITPEIRIKLCREALKENAPEMVLIMLARHLRLMISTFDKDTFWPPNMMWQKTKLTKIAQQFGLNTIIKQHHELASIDTQSKTGTLAGSLESRLIVWMGNLKSHG